MTPRTSDVETLVIENAGACEAWLSKSGYGADDDVSDLDDDGLGLFQAAAIAGYSAVRGVAIDARDRAGPPDHA